MLSNCRDVSNVRKISNVRDCETLKRVTENPLEIAKHFQKYVRKNEGKSRACAENRRKIFKSEKHRSTNKNVAGSSFQFTCYDYVKIVHTC